MTQLSVEDTSLSDPLVASLGPGSRLLDGRFVIERALGRGEFGAVYAVRDRERAELVALKVLLRQDGASLFRLKREFRSLADVNHPNLVRLYELFEDEGRWFFTMELLEGEHLLAHLIDSSDDTRLMIDGTTQLSPSPDSDTDMDTDEDSTKPKAVSTTRTTGFTPSSNNSNSSKIRDWLSGLATGIQAIHDAGKLHRDLKPSNILVERSGRVVILDFGLVADQHASSAMSLAEAELRAGTPAYMAPEVVMGAGAREASDWYALGVILYYGLFGAPLFSGTVADILAKKALQPASHPARGDGVEVDQELVTLCLHLLDPDPAQRAGFNEVVAAAGTMKSLRTSWRPLSESSSQLFVGRAHELAMIVDEFELVRNGSSRVVFIPGASGIGKTALLQEACLQLLAHESRAWVLPSACYERENLPFKAVDGAVDVLSGELETWSSSQLQSVLPECAELLPLLFPVCGGWKCFASVASQLKAGKLITPADDPIALRRAAFQAFGSLLARLANGVPLVLALDDLQWTDLDSVRLILEVLTMDSSPPMLILGTYRSGTEADVGPLHDLMKGLEEVRIPVLTLDAHELSAQDAEDLVRKVAEDLTAAAVSEVAKESYGLPYFIVQLAYQRRLGSLVSEPTLAGMLRAQVGEISENARQVLLLLALSPAPLPRSVLFGSVSSELEQSSILSELRNRRLLRVFESGSNPRIDLYHESVRAALMSGLANGEQVDLHDSLANVWLQHRSPDPEILLHHLRGANRLLEAGHYARQAAAQAERGMAFERAAECHEIALHLLQPVSITRREMLTDWARCLGAAGHGARAADAYVLAARESQGALRAELRWKAAEQLLQSRSDATELLFDVLAEVGVGVPGAVMRNLSVIRSGLGYALRPLLRIPVSVSGGIDELTIRRFDRLLSSGVGMMFGGDLELCIYFLVEASRLGINIAEPGRAACAYALKIEAELHIKGLSFQDALRRLEQAGRLLDQTQSESICAYGSLLLGQTHFSAGDLEGACTAFRKAEALFEKLPGQTVLADAARTSLSFMQLLNGQLFSAARTGARLVVLGEARRQPFFRKSGHVDLATFCLTRGDVEGANVHLSKLVESEADAESWFGLTSLQLGALLGAYDFRFRRPLRLFDEAEIQFRSLAHRHHYRPWLLMGKAVALLDLLAHDQCQDAGLTREGASKAALSCARELQSSTGVRVLVPYGLTLEVACRLQQGHSLESGKGQSALQLLRKADALFEAYGAIGYRNMARRAQGACIGAEVDGSLIHEADAVLSEMGVIDPERLSAAYFPGFAPMPGRSPA